MAVLKMEQNMEYILKLSEEQRVVFMKVLARLAKADGYISDDEKEFIKDVAGVYGISAEKTQDILKKIDDKELIEDAKKINNRKASLELIKEMCILAHADNELTERETLLIGQIGQAMGIELEKIEQISRWIIDRIIWQEEGKIIFEEVC